MGLTIELQSSANVTMQFPDEDLSLDSSRSTITISGSGETARKIRLMQQQAGDGRLHPERQTCWKVTFDDGTASVYLATAARFGIGDASITLEPQLRKGRFTR